MTEAVLEDDQETPALEDEDDISSDDVPPPLPQNSAPLEPERLSAMMTSSFGRCDEVLCRAVGVVNSYTTALDFVSGLYPAASRFVRSGAFDLARPCQLDATSTGIQFLTLEAVRVSFNAITFFSVSPHLKSAL